jgi:hypothetical protein
MDVDKVLQHPGVVDELVTCELEVFCALELSSFLILCKDIAK